MLMIYIKTGKIIGLYYFTVNITFLIALDNSVSRTWH